MEKMTERELQQLKDLQAKQKRVQRAREEFLKQVDEEKEELMKRWNMKDRLQVAAHKIGVEADTLFEWITSDAQVAYIKRKLTSDNDE